MEVYGRGKGTIGIGGGKECYTIPSYYQLGGGKGKRERGKMT